MATVNANALIAGIGGVTNWVRNPRAEGGTTGSPGTPPTNWAVVNAAPGLTSTIVGFGTTSDGIPYMDVSYAGTTSAAGGNAQFFTEAGVGIKGAPGQTWTHSVFLQLLSGTIPANTLILQIQEGDAGGVALVTGQLPGFTPGSVGPLIAQRYSFTYTTVNAGCATVRPRFLVNPFANATAYNFTLRIGAPQMELGTQATSLILPAVGAPVATTRGIEALPISYPLTTKLATAQINGVGGATNWIRNPRAEGGVAGSPGTLPANWGVVNIQPGLTQTVVGFGTTSDGIPYWDINFAGTTTSVGSIQMFLEGANTIPAVQGQAWTNAIFLQMVSGNFPALGLYMQLQEMDSGGIGIGGATAQSPGFTPGSSGPLSAQRYTLSYTTTAAGCAFIRPRFILNLFLNATAYNFTLRMGAPQMELGARATSMILPPVGTPVVTARGLEAAPLYIPPTSKLANALIAGIGGATNTIRNPRAEGGVAGTPGTAPTYWQIATTYAGVTQSVVGIGADGDGIPYIDVNWSGTPTGSGSIVITPDNAATGAINPAVQGQTWTWSFFLQMLSGALPAPAILQLQILEFNSSNTSVATGTAPSYSIATSGGPLSAQHYVYTYTTVNAACAWIRPRFNFVTLQVGTAYNFTVRIGAPQMELGARATSMILPPVGTPVAATRGLEAAPTYYPVTSKLAGALINGVGGATNWVRNPRGEGGTAGSPGVAPTNWVITPNPLGMTSTLAYGVDAASGASYVDYTCSGTSTGGQTAVQIEATNGIPVVGNQTYTFSCFLNVAAGSLPTTVVPTLREFDASLTLINSNAQTSVTPPSGGSLTNYRGVWTITTAATTAFLQPRFLVNLPAGTWSFTLRTAAPQVELGARATSMILPPVGVPGTSTRGLEAAPTSYPLTTKLAAAQFNGTGGQTNLIRNPAAEGGIPGTPGTAPTYWTLPGTGTGLSAPAFVGTGFDAAGIPYLDISYAAGTSTGGQVAVNFEAANIVASSVGQTFTISLHALAIGGPLPSNIYFVLAETDSVGNATGISGAGAGFVPPTSGNLADNRHSLTYTATDPTARFIRPRLFINTPTGPIAAFTLRIGAPQFEIGSRMSPLILPPPGTVVAMGRGIEADPINPKATGGAIGGAGSVSALASVARPASAQIGGAGSVSALASVARPASAQIGGTGSVLASASVLAAGSAQIGALGALRASLFVAKFTSAEIDGEGWLLPGQTPVRMAAAAEIDGVGGQTNWVRNPRAEGGATGAPGVDPTYWDIPDNQFGLSVTVVGFGIETGVPYVDVNYAGTAPAGGSINIQFETTTAVTADVGSIWTLSGYFKVVSGTLPNNLQLCVREYDGNTVLLADERGFIQSNNGPFINPPSSGNLSDARSVFPIGLTGSNTVYIQPRLIINLPPGSVDNFTLRIGGPQLEEGDHATSLILPQAGNISAATRGVEAAPLVAKFTGAVIAGTGSVRANALEQEGAAAEIDGVASVRSTALVRVSGAARIDGAAFIGGSSTGAQPAAARISGSASVGAVPNSAIPAIARIGGTGSVAAAAIEQEGGAAEIDGEGFILVDALVQRPANARFDGIAGLRAFGGVAVPEGSLIAGIASVSASVSLRVPAFAQIDGVGGTGSLSNSAVPASARIGGQSSLSVSPTGAQPANARIGGVGAVALVPPPVSANVSARIGGVGSAIAAPFPAKMAFAEIDGLGGVQISPPFTARFANALIAGVGGATNWYRNPRAEGAVVGSPGTAPINWNFVFSTVLARTVVGTGVSSDGIPYVDLQADGTATAAGEYVSIYPDGYYPLAIKDQTWTSSAFLRLEAGTLPSPGVTFVIEICDASLTRIGAYPASSITSLPSSSSKLGDCRYSFSATILDPATVYVRPRINIGYFPNGAPSSLRVRIGAPQFEIGARATSMILPPVGAPAAATRGIEAAPLVVKFTGAQIDGVGQISATPLVAKYAELNVIGGEGNVSATASVRMPARARIDGQGSVAVSTAGRALGAARIDAVGNVSAVYTLVGQALGQVLVAAVGNVFVGVPKYLANTHARIGGEGAVHATAWVVTKVRARISGQATFDPEVGVGMHSGARIFGRGAVLAVASRAVPVAVKLFGRAGVQATAFGHDPGETILTGVGLIRASTTVLVHAAAHIAGQGAVQATGSAHAEGLAGLHGTGSVTMTSGVPHGLATAHIGGQGHVAASTIHAQAAVAQIDGEGEVQATGTAILLVRARINGRASVDAEPDTHGRARIDGAGRVQADATRLPLTLTAGAAIHGSGALKATATAHLLTHALIHGVGSIGPLARILTHVHALIGGTGHIRTDADKPPVMAHARLRGTAHVAATGAAALPGRARIYGKGTPHVHGAVLLLAKTKIAGSGRVRARLAVLPPARAAIHGIGQIIADPDLKGLHHASAAIHGQGMVRIDPHIPRERVATQGVHLPPIRRSVTV